MIVGGIFINYFSFEFGFLFVFLIDLPIVSQQIKQLHDTNFLLLQFALLIIKMTVQYFKHNQFAKSFLPNKVSKRNDQTNAFCFEDKNKKFVLLSNFYYLNEDSNKTYL